MSTPAHLKNHRYITGPHADPYRKAPRDYRSGCLSFLLFLVFGALILLYSLITDTY